MAAVREEMNLLANLDGSSGGGEVQAAWVGWVGRGLQASSSALQCCPRCGLPTHPALCARHAGDIERYCSDLSALLAQKQASLSQLQLRLHAFQQLMRTAMNSRGA